MVNAVREWYALIRDGLDAFGALNPDWLAGGLILGLLLSWTLTQRLKRAAELSRRSTEAAAFLIGSLFCLGISTQGRLYPLPWLEIAVALLVGLIAPMAYKILIAVAGDRFAWVRSLRREK